MPILEGDVSFATEAGHGVDIIQVADLVHERLLDLMFDIVRYVSILRAGHLI